MLLLQINTSPRQLYICFKGLLQMNSATNRLQKSYKTTFIICNISVQSPDYIFTCHLIGAQTTTPPLETSGSSCVSLCICFWLR